MRAGDIVLAALAQADEQPKMRPALLLCMLPPFGDWLVCGITTQTQHAVPAFDDVIGPEDADFRDTGLRARSLIRLGFLGTLARTQIAGALGCVSTDRVQRLRRALAQHLQSGPSE